ncbi:MAG: NAD(P)H-hydrate dehydratase [Deltaproteobacteria bacterium]|nr:NAD(P)H-hydrate dehydratase [Deltaproteobacteria bacterium]
MVYEDGYVMKIATAQEMREIDRITIRDYGIPGLVLMERAGLAVALKVIELYPGQKALVLCGGGNNGGDGLAAARELHNRGFNVKVLMVSEKAPMSPDCKIQYRIAKNFGVHIESRKAVSAGDIHAAVVIDAVFGTGLARPVKGALADAFSFINKSNVPVVSIDIPSGISSDTGEALGQAISADCTVTFGLPKTGHFLYPGADYTGRLFIEDIGFPKELLVSEKLRLDLIDPGLVRGLLPQRLKSSHKGDYGHVLVVAGSRGKTGAALLAAKACLRSGAGLVTIGVPGSLLDVFQSCVTEEMLLPLPDDGSGMLSADAADEILGFAARKIDAIAIGPGIGVSQDTEKIMAQLIKKSAVPLVIDADGINALRGKTNIFSKAKAPIILTPHQGEMSRLLKNKWDGSIYSQSPESSEGGVRERINRTVPFILRFSRMVGVYLVLKGAPTVVAGPEGRAFVNTTGNPGMATAGAGDVLTGIIASFAGQGLSPLESSVLGVYLHGFAGDSAEREKGGHSMIASDIIRFLPDAFAHLNKEA